MNFSDYRTRRWWPAVSSLVTGVVVLIPMILGLVVVEPRADPVLYVAAAVGASAAAFAAYLSSSAERRAAGQTLERINALDAERASVANRSIHLSKSLYLILHGRVTFEAFVTSALTNLSASLIGIPGCRVAFLAYCTPLMSRIVGEGLHLSDPKIAFQAVGASDGKFLDWVLSAETADCNAACALIETESNKDKHFNVRRQKRDNVSRDGLIMGPANERGETPLAWYRHGLDLDTTFGTATMLGVVCVDWWGDEVLSEVDEELIADCARWIGLAFKFARLPDMPHRRWGEQTVDNIKVII